MCADSLSYQAISVVHPVAASTGHWATVQRIRLQALDLRLLRGQRRSQGTETMAQRSKTSRKGSKATVWSMTTAGASIRKVGTNRDTNRDTARWSHDVKRTLKVIGGPAKSQKLN